MGLRLVRLLVALPALVCLGPCAQSALAAPSGGISGKVTDASTHQPIVGIQVCAFSMSAEGSEEEVEEGGYGCATTESGGEYAIAKLNAGNFAVVFAAPSNGSLNYVAQFYNDKVPPAEPDVVAVSAGVTTREVNAELMEGGEITGTITNASSGAPVGGALACALIVDSHGEPEAVACAASGANGEYTLKGLPSGNLEVGFLGPGFAIQYYPGRASFAEATPITIAAAKEVKGGIDAALQPLPLGTSEGGSKTLGGGATESSQLSGRGLPGPLSSRQDLAVSLLDPRVRVRHGDALVELACSAGASCRGKLVLTYRRTIRHKSREVTIGAERYSLRRGSHHALSVRLDKVGRELLSAGHGRIVATLEFSQLAPAPHRKAFKLAELIDAKVTAKH